jgi:hypothetical protein
MDDKPKIIDAASQEGDDPGCSSRDWGSLQALRPGSDHGRAHRKTIAGIVGGPVSPRPIPTGRSNFPGQAAWRAQLFQSADPPAGIYLSSTLGKPSSRTSIHSGAADLSVS